jgi:hypothetical protein
VTLSAILIGLCGGSRRRKKIVTICSSDSTSESKGVPRETSSLPARYHASTDSMVVRAREALALSFVDEELAPRAIPERIFTRKPCTSGNERPPIRYLASDRNYCIPAGATSNKNKNCLSKSRSRRPKSHERTFGEPFRPEPVVARGQGRGPQRGRVPGEHSNGRLCPQGHEDRDRACRPYATRGNEEGSCFLEKPPEQEDTKSSPSSSMELKFELDT